jgi:hypothetical protein
VKLHLHIDALAIEADWPRADRADFTNALRAALETELAMAARRGGFTAIRAERRPALNLSPAAMATPAAAGAAIARIIAGEVTPKSTPGGSPRPASARSR